MGAELSSVADDLSCIECRKKRSPHAPVLVQPPRFPGSMPSTASTAGDAFIGGVDQAIAGVDSVVDEAFDSGFIDLLGR